MSLNVVWHDDFAGPALDARWIGGHLNRSAEVSLKVDQGLRFDFPAGTEYASAGVVTRQPLTGDFEADIHFEVAQPVQGTTFELAAILVAPPAQTGLPPTAFADAHRVFNVHGAPPYVSSELDEDNGWRIGTNWGNRQGARNAAGDWVADNRDNVYGKSLRGPVLPGARGWLRLARSGGQHWQASGRVGDGDPWISSGNRSTAVLGAAVYLRLAAKHWVKRRLGLTVAPANRVVLTRFTLRA